MRPPTITSRLRGFSRAVRTVLVLLLLSLVTNTLPGAMVAAPVQAASGDFSIDFVAAAPESYNHLTGGGAYDDRTVGVGKDIVESLEGGNFACGDIATFFAAVTVDNTQTAAGDEPQTIEMDFSFLMDTTGQSGVAIGDIVRVQVNYDPIEDLITGEDIVDDGITDDGGSVAMLTAEGTSGPLFRAGSVLTGTVELTDLEAGEQVVVRIDTKLYCDPGSKPTGNLQAQLTNARLTFVNDTTPVEPPQAISGGAQTIPWRQIGDIATPAIDVQKTVTTADGTCGVDDVEEQTVTAGDTVKYCYVVTNNGDPGTNLFNVIVSDDNGTPGNLGDDFPVTLVGLTDVDGDGDSDDVANSDSATGEALVTIVGPAFGEDDQTIVNTATAEGDDSVIQPTTLTDTDTATVIAQPPPVVAPQPRVIKGDAEGNDTVAALDEPGGPVTINVVVYNGAAAGAGDATLTSLVDDIYGNITTTGHDGITASTCAAGGVIPGGGSYSCSFTVDIASEPDTIVDTLTATLTNAAAEVSDDDQANVVINDVPSAMHVVKTAGTATDGETYHIDEPGGTVTFYVTVHNDSTVDSITIDTLTDDVYGDLTLADNSTCVLPQTIAAGGSYSCGFTGDVSGNAGDSETDVVTASGVDDDDTPVSDDDDATVTITVVLPPSAVTDSSLCVFDRDPGTPEREFRLLFTPDVKQWPAYKLTASNPGQYYYNVFYVGDGAGTATISMTIPYPFVTQGATPVHVYTDVTPTVDVETDYTCFDVADEDAILSLGGEEFQIAIGDWDGMGFGSTIEVVLHDVPVDALGLIYANIHLDYGLKGGEDRYGKSENPDGTADAVSLSDPPQILIADRGEYIFSSKVDGQIHSDSIVNVNEFKKTPGVGGFIHNGSGDPVAGALVRLYIPESVKNRPEPPYLDAVTDEDGWYMIEYKHIGKPTIYQMEVWDEDGNSIASDPEVPLKGNAYAEVNFLLE